MAGDAAAGGASGAGGAGVHPATGLRPRPVVAPDVMAALTAAVDQAWPRPVAVEPAGDRSHLAWRFSGRWWHRPLPTRRARPFTAH